jgi:L-alanine-DL-glutamate epimerase-like enolase superfamily enzyme
LEYAISSHFSFTSRPKPVADEIVGIYNVHGGFNTDDISEGVTDRINPRMHNGVLYKPEGAGLGMELNMDYIKKYLLDYKSLTK